MMNEPRTIIELSDAELDQVSGGEVGTGVLQEGNGHFNFHSNAPNTPAADRGFNGNGAQIVNLCSC
jgi:bacteriocin-like protein